jgi:tetratricopeptide (TPR) repeat protein
LETTLPTPSTPLAADSSERLEVEAEDGSVQLDRVGPSLWGCVYRSVDGRRYYRIIPSADGITAEMRDEMRRWQDRPRQPGIAPVVEVGQTSADGRSCLLVRYDIDAPDTLLEALAGDDPAARVRAVAAAARALPGWWGRVGVGLVPMPSDVLLREQVPYLLAMPRWGIPDVGAFFGEPGRVQQLPPEIVCGRAGEAWANASDLYALGVTLLRCFTRLPDDDAEQTFAHIASGTAFTPERCESTLAFWLQRVEPVQAAVALARHLIDPSPKVRSAVDPMALAEQLDACATAMNAVAAVTELWSGGEPREAMDLAQNILVDEPSYELYVLAGTVSWRGLRNSLEALSLFEKAIAIDPVRTEAYAEEVEMIGSLRDDIIAQLAAAVDPSFADRLDTTMWNAFNRLPPDRQQAAEPDLARYLLDRGQFARASQFAYGRLHDADGKLHWWNFDMMLAYAEAFLELDHLDDAEGVLARIKSGLAKVRANKTVRETRIQELGSRLAQLELRAHERRKELSSA